ncbi:MULTISPECIES: hypothetical protein [Cyanophyceae]|uniref:hypothetical protein n=1 Tax=Cyanophyceae TaxID=3028117 RepID=UPI00016DC5B3|nr:MULTISPECIES: hypothetical protein [Cyanophyceae]ACA98656.1 hypothetical protein SYNPCC7002_A0651 [Picosynechococcus sp. PCC 7002]SMH40144.1 hypothetical protein SAMN06272755_1079 [Picosynechococcus sp. OG1]SMQ78329.1 hypothetical protein SAMN06272774_0360 [Synechococcus sp. 7002]
MDINRASEDLAQRVKKFFHFRADLCENLLKNDYFTNGKNSLNLPPIEYDPSCNLHTEAYSIACTAIDGLSYIESCLLNFSKKKMKNETRFCRFLEEYSEYQHLRRVSTPFLSFSLEKENTDEVFRSKLKRDWIDKKSLNESHRVYEDPEIQELVKIYNNLSQRDIKNPHDIFKKFTYSALIYKYYRCSFVHEYQASPYTALYNGLNKNLSIRQFSCEVYSDGSSKNIEIIPQLDLGLKILTDCLRNGSQIIHNLIIQEQIETIPNRLDDLIKVNGAIYQKPMPKGET